MSSVSIVPVVATWAAGSNVFDETSNVCLSNDVMKSVYLGMDTLVLASILFLW